MKNNTNHGFTIIELVVVMTIMTFLMMISSSIYTSIKSSEYSLQVDTSMNVLQNEIDLHLLQTNYALSGVVVDENYNPSKDQENNIYYKYPYIKVSNKSENKLNVLFCYLDLNKDGKRESLLQSKVSCKNYGDLGNVFIEGIYFGNLSSSGIIRKNSLGNNEIPVGEYKFINGDNIQNLLIQSDFSSNMNYFMFYSLTDKSYYGYYGDEKILLEYLRDNYYQTKHNITSDISDIIKFKVTQLLYNLDDIEYDNQYILNFYGIHNEKN